MYKSAIPPVVAAVTAMAMIGLSIKTKQANAQTASPPSPTFIRAESTGTVSVVPNTVKPADCLRAAKEPCTLEVRGSEVSTAYDGPGQLTERVTLDFSKPVSSDAGVCFPQIGIGKLHTSRGDYNFYNQGESCLPPKGADVPPGFRNGTLHVVITGGTGRYQHAVGTLAVTYVAHPSGTLYHTTGAFIGVQP